MEDKKNIIIGFNRRFSPYMKELKNRINNRSTPIIANYNMNAGAIPGDHWVHDPEIGGGRIKGEACHIIDLMNYLTNSEPVKVYTESISTDSDNIFVDDNVSITLYYQDGSVCNIIYTALGDKSFPKETMTLFTDGMVFDFDNYKKLVSHSNNSSNKSKSFSQKKGFNEELESLKDSIINGQDSPVSFREVIASSLATLKAFESMEKGIPVKIDIDEFISQSI